VDAGADVVAGHSSHHMKGFEVYKGKLVVYGLGDLISDYEGIRASLLLQSLLSSLFCYSTERK
jgi:poly-gamma-glutamate capsule biosynthesis protein CapA/YwtB (metallophosphatase superfamily)